MKVDGRWRRRLGSLRTRVLACVAAALVPGFVLVGYLQADRRAQLLADARQRADAQAQLVLADQQDVARAARQTLGVVAALPQVQSLGEQCSAMLATAVAASDDFIQLGWRGSTGWSAAALYPSRRRSSPVTGRGSAGRWQVVTSRSATTRWAGSRGDLR